MQNNNNVEKLITDLQTVIMIINNYKCENKIVQKTTFTNLTCLLRT